MSVPKMNAEGLQTLIRDVLAEEDAVLNEISELECVGIQDLKQMIKTMARQHAYQQAANRIGDIIKIE